MSAAGTLEPGTRAELAGAVLAAVGQEYPHVLIQELNSDADVVPPRVLNPSFFGSYDWHSAVHCHWTLLRCVAVGLPGELAPAVAAVLDDHLSAQRLAGELKFYSSAGGRVAERPYGWAWLVMLHAECQRVGRAAEDPALRAGGARWAEALEPLEALLRSRLLDYFASVLAFPIRSGTHGNTAYALQLMQQAARAGEDPAMGAAVATAARRFFSDDAPLPWSAPPSGGDFLDPALVEAALMADVLGAEAFADWFAQVCPPGTTPDWDPPAFRPDGPDPGTVHLEGLLVSRAWCLDRLGRALPPGEPLAAAARRGRDAHLAAVAGIDAVDGFNRAHWLPTYLVYLTAWLAGEL